LTPERWAQIEELFHRAAECEPQRRTVLLDELCSSDPELRREVEALLSSDKSASGDMQAAVRSGLDAASFPLVGESVSHYRILDGIGGGGMGLVYRAEDVKLGRHVAVKFLPEESAKDPSALGRFEREARSASALEHPNICPIYEFGEHGGQPFLVMQLLEGRTLRELIAEAGTRKPPLELPQLLDLAIQIANGLDAAHRHAIIHRDIKPANVFVTTEGQAKILDFGLAKLAYAGPAAEEDGEPAAPGAGEPPPAGREERSPRTLELPLSRTGVAIGTAGYMSPEQVRGEKLDARTDLFSFGVVLYEMATGQRAFVGDTAQELHDAILTRTPPRVRELNPEVPPQLERIVSRALEKERNRRYQSAVELLADLRPLHDGAVAPAPPARMAWLPKRWFRFAASSAALLAIAVTSLLYYRHVRRANYLNEQDTVILASFINTTGDAIFDSSLHEALYLSLKQSPFLNVLGAGKVNATLRLMPNLPKNPFASEFIPEVCRRVGSKAYIVGSIRGPAGAYVVGVKAVNCQSAKVLANEEIKAISKEDVLDALGDAATRLRAELGEPPSQVWRYSVPLKQVTPSLEALKEYSLAEQVGSRQGDSAQLPHELRAIELDPSFALAYSTAGRNYLNQSQSEKALEYISRAFELQDHATEIQRFQIASMYYFVATGELNKVAETLQNQIAIYPRASDDAYSNLSIVLSELGLYDKAAEMARQAIPFAPNSGILYHNLTHNLIALQRFKEARETLQAALARKPDTIPNHRQLYELAFLAGDSQGMSDQLAWLRGQPGYETVALAMESETTAFFGNLRKARALTRQAVGSALRIDFKEAAATWWDVAALREAAFGNPTEARQAVAEALKLAPASDGVQVLSAFALAKLDDVAGAESLRQTLAQTHPLDTEVQSLWLPTIDAQLALAQENPEAAIERLHAAKPMELGFVQYLLSTSCLDAVDVRGEAYLALRDGKAAAGEFQRIIDHNGIVQYCYTGALAHLQLGRAYAMAGDTAKARAAYNDFLTLWKDADPDIPILKQAKAEYVKLQ